MQTTGHAECVNLLLKGGFGEKCRVFGEKAWWLEKKGGEGSGAGKKGVGEKGGVCVEEKEKGLYWRKMWG